MAKISKRKKAINAKLKPNTVYTFDDAAKVIKEVASTKFTESMDVAILLGVDTKKSDQTVRGAVVLPNGTGRTVRVCVLAQGPAAEAAKKAGAEYVGFEDMGELLKEKIESGNLDIDVVIASPDAMRIVGQLGRILGPKGLMPNPKLGTVTPDVATAVKNAKAGQVAYRADKGGIVHSTIGKVTFEVDSLRQNLEALVNDVKRVKPSTSKGVYLKKIILSSTMGPGIVIDHNVFA